MIYAHSTSTTGKSDWETLFGHAGAVARTARKNTESFAPELGEITGWLHDLGKMKVRFQIRLSDPSVIESHSSEARAISTNVNPAPFPRFSRKSFWGIMPDCRMAVAPGGCFRHGWRKPKRSIRQQAGQCRE